VRRIQQLRKDSELDISDRIALTLSESPLVGSLLSVHKSYIAEETLTVELELTTGSEELFDSANVTFSLGDEEVTIGLNKL